LDTKYGEEYGDAIDYHTFTVVNNMRSNGKIYLDFVPTFNKKQCQYNAAFRIVIDVTDRQTFE